MTAKAVMVLGTTSGAGKSWLAASSMALTLAWLLKSMLSWRTLHDEVGAVAEHRAQAPRQAGQTRYGGTDRGRSS